MYAHARACSIRRKVSDSGHDVDKLIATYNHNTDDYVDSPRGLVELLRTIENYDEVLLKSVNESRPHLFAKHILTLANNYNAFYRDCHVLQEGEINVMHMVISEVARNLLRTGCSGLGIIPLEVM